MGEKAKTSAKTLDETISEIADSLPPAVAKTFLRKYNEMSYSVKQAIGEYQKALASISDRNSIERIRKSLDELQQVCEANPDYMSVYEAAKKEAKDSIVNQVAKEGLDFLED